MSGLVPAPGPRSDGFFPAIAASELDPPGVALVLDQNSPVPKHPNASVFAEPLGLWGGLPPAFVAKHNGVFTGIKWQCVELARRYWLVNYGYVFESIPPWPR